MFQHNSRTAFRLAHSSLSAVRPAAAAGKRFLTTAPPHAKSRGWRNSALRWGIAVAGIYYYNTSPIFAEHPQNNLLNPNVDAIDDYQQHDTLDKLTASSRSKGGRERSVLQSTIEQLSEEDAAHRQENTEAIGSSERYATPPHPATEGAIELEQEADNEGAFNPVTGEINWDCPCLGGMAHGPCGPEFREAFSCFIYSNEEPKGMECVEKFSAMQTCFRDHPEYYKDELEDNEELDAELALEKEELSKEIAEKRAQVEGQLKSGSQTQQAKAEGDASKENRSKSKSAGSTNDPQPEAKTTSHTQSEYSAKKEAKNGAASKIRKEPQRTATSAEAQPESESLVPKASHDATDATSRDSHSVAQ